MQAFAAFFGDNKGLAIAAIAILCLAAILVLLLIYRLLFGRRLHMSGGGRTRQPRLGVVDAFDLDRQRQLVLVRRDNVEHLIMIGGPNDVVIETAVVRQQPSVSTTQPRDKEAGPSSPPAPLPASAQPSAMPQVNGGPMLGIAVPPPAQPTVSPPAARPADSQAPVLDLVHVRREPAKTDPAPPAPPAPPATDTPQPATRPMQARTTAPLPPRTATPPATSLPSSTTGTPGSGTATTPTRAPLSTLRTPLTPAAPRPITSPGPRPSPLPPLSRGTSAASLRRDPPVTAPPAAPSTDQVTQPPREAPAAPAPVASPSVASGVEAQPAPAVAIKQPKGATPTSPPPVISPQAATRPEPTVPTTFDTLESLEEEMAKLLGRASAAPPKQ